MPDILHPRIDITDLVPGFEERLQRLVAGAIAEGMSEDDIRIYLGMLAHEEYLRQARERRA